MADPFCDGEVSLKVDFKGNAVMKTGRCREVHGHDGDCRTQVALLTIFGHLVQVEVAWFGPLILSPTGRNPSPPPPPQNMPPPRPGPYQGPPVGPGPISA